jgi:hypothetical protein
MIRANPVRREALVPNTVAQMTREEFREMMEAIIERKLVEILGDPDDGLDVLPSVRERLVRQMQTVRHGDRGTSLDDVAAELGLD